MGPARLARPQSHPSLTSETDTCLQVPATRSATHREAVIQLMSALQGCSGQEQARSSGKYTKLLLIFPLLKEGGGRLERKEEQAENSM